jgi:hypothetical protein
VRDVAVPPNYSARVYDDAAGMRNIQAAPDRHGLADFNPVLGLIMEQDKFCDDENRKQSPLPLGIGADAHPERILETRPEQEFLEVRIKRVGPPVPEIIALYQKCHLAKTDALHKFLGAILTTASS